MKKLAISFLILLASLLSFSVAEAAGSQCQVIYGGGEVCPPQVSFSVNKQVMRPGKGGEFVDNLTINDPKFTPDQTVTFKIIIQNTDTTRLSHVDIVDTLPQFLTFVSGPGTFDSNQKTLSFGVDNLDAGRSQTFTFTAKTARAQDLPADQGVICVINTVKATEKGGAMAQDTSQLCIEKMVLALLPTPQVFQAPPMKVTPPTGPEMLGLIALIPVGGLGFYLRKKSTE